MEDETSQRWAARSSTEVRTANSPGQAQVEGSTAGKLLARDNCTFDRGLLTEQKRNMSCTALRELLIRELGQGDANRFEDVHLQNLIDKGYTDHGALKDATRDGLQSPPPLLPALVDKLLKCFKPAGASPIRAEDGSRLPPKFDATLSTRAMAASTVRRLWMSSSIASGRFLFSLRHC
ncbi:hypothetical protein WJX82_003232 [Trebouxia sp. C0006]